MTTAPFRRWAGPLLALAGVLLTGCTMAGARGATISTIARTGNAGDCSPTAVTGTAPGLDPAQEANAKTVVGAWERRLDRAVRGSRELTVTLTSRD